MLPDRAAPGWSVVSDDGPSARTPWPPASRSLRSLTRFAGISTESVVSSRTHGRFVVRPRPFTTGPATPKHAASTAPRGAPARKRATAASNAANSRLGSAASRTSVSSPSRTSKSARAVFVPPTSPARIMPVRPRPSALPPGRPLDVAAELLAHRREDHLDEVAGARGTAVEVAVLGGAADLLASRRPRDAPHAGRERPEDRVEALDDRPLATDHEAVAALEPPDAAARADVDVVNLLLAKHLHPSH